MLLLIVPIVELYVIVQVSGAIGFLNTLAVLVVVSLVGAWLVKREGWRVWRRFQEALKAGQTPSREIADGVCVLGAGALLMTPGFVTDVVGILLLLPPTRAVFRGLLLRRFTTRTSVTRATYRGRVYDTTAQTKPPHRDELEP